MRLSKLFLTAVLVNGVIFASPVMAVSSVKKIGGINNNYVPSNARNNENRNLPSSAANKRVSSVRMLGSGKTYNNLTGVQKKVNSVDTVRASGLRGNVIKGLSTKLSSNTTSNASQPTNKNSSDLEMRINDLEKEIEKKQDDLISGEGIDISGSTISVSQEMANLPEEINQINQKIDELTEQVDGVTLSDEPIKDLRDALSDENDDLINVGLLKDTIGTAGANNVPGTGLVGAVEGLQDSIGNTSMGTTATTITGAIKELNNAIDELETAGQTYNEGDGIKVVSGANPGDASTIGLDLPGNPSAGSYVYKIDSAGGGTWQALEVEKTWNPGILTTP